MSPCRAAALSPRVDGLVRDTRVDAGERVKAGQVLFDIYVSRTDEVGGGWSNRVLHLRTTEGGLAVKQVRNPWGVEGWRAWLAEGWRAEAGPTGALVLRPVEDR